MLDKLIRPMLPRTYGVGAGIIVDYEGEIVSSVRIAEPGGTGAQSGQQDLVVYDPEVLPPVLEMGRTGVYPIEAVLCVIEVTSNLDSAALKTIMWRALKLCSLIYSGDVIYTGDVLDAKTDSEKYKSNVTIEPQLANMKEAWQPYVCAFGLDGNKNIPVMHEKAAKDVMGECASDCFPEDALPPKARERLERIDRVWWKKLYPYVHMVTIPTEVCSRKNAGTSKGGCSRYENKDRQIHAYQHKGSEFPYVAAFLGTVGMEAQFRRLKAGHRIPTLYLFKNSDYCS
jgi:hypothetical protein